MKILLLGGTTEGRLLAKRLAELPVELTVSVATQQGEEALLGIPNLRIEQGRRDLAGLRALLQGQDLCIDATHPYAVAVSKTIREACALERLPLRRLLREKSETEGVRSFPSCAAAASYLATCPGNILLSIGTKELAAFSMLESSRLYARVLPSVEAIALCLKEGLPHRNILALQGPFSQKLNEAMLEQYEISYLVTKDGGAEGGFAEKRAAARHSAVELLLIERPEEQGETAEAIYQSSKEALGCS